MNLKTLIAVLAILASAAVFAACGGEQDKAQAKNVAARVNAHLSSAEFAAIYEESSPRFKSVGSKSEFISQMTALHKALGSFRNANEIAYETSLDSTLGRIYVLIFKLECEQGEATERLTVVRSTTGEMQLWKLDIQPTN